MPQKLSWNNFTPLTGQSFDPATLGRLKADGENAKDGNLTGWDCRVCRNKGVVYHSREDGTLYVTDCDCMRIRTCIREMEQSGLGAVIKDLTFERFDATEDWQQVMKRQAEEYASSPDGWLLCCGQPGSGKTHLCVAVCRELLYRGRSVRYAPWRQFVSDLKALTLDSDRTDTMRKLQTADVLFLDDLFKVGRSADGMCRPTQADINITFELLNHRYINRMTTIVSTELMPQELSGVDDALGSRIIERAEQHTIIVGRDSKRNYRLRNVLR